MPEQWGFLRNPLTPFRLTTPDGESLYVWHILPLELYRRNVQALVDEPDGLCQDVEARFGFRLLKNDPKSLLIIYLHGAAGTLASGWRPQSYRALSSVLTEVHVPAIDYRGFGHSTGTPIEQGLLTDALTLATFAMGSVGLPPDRIVIFGQSLGTAVALELAHHLALQPRPVLFAGIVFGCTVR
ncbi:hypothetical protein LTR96_011555 [Exophiala xenobiotica]|nr:hypothetical protein LTR72_011617 [Exophiala xenobiotica]KAK5263003.1 hypothetical protein LTR96_011555 [Exophiala xenobiotica]KAK5284694.1 hypothetical protein LTR14_011563 [Exophiala xenobiotica]KAK5332320.1 hypothetical protein LTR98_011550 [Exophiala xenobiotica]KAK5466305.1 hypothetical protein LTR55_011582 [Exophiala xenobiotica]